MEDQEFNVKLGRIRTAREPKPKTFLQKVLKAAHSAGQYSARRSNSKTAKKAPNSFGRGASNFGRSRLFGAHRRVVIKARIVRHTDAKFRSSTVARYMRYLTRDGVTKDGEKAHVFDATLDQSDEKTFAKNCEKDRHDFRFIISPEDMVELGDIQAFTRDLMKQMEADCGTKLEWVAVDHWNTDNPHLHVVVRGVADDGKDLVISRDYMSYGFRSRAEDLVSIELGPKPVQEIQKALDREITAERWTRIDREIMSHADDLNFIDLRTSEPEDTQLRSRRLMIGRLQHLEKMGLADNIGPSQWSIALEAQSTLRDFGIRNDIIKTMHLAFRENAPNKIHDFVIEDNPEKPIIGKLIEKGLHDELSGEAYAIIDGIDGKAHYIRMKGIEAFDQAPGRGGIVELRPVESDKTGKRFRVLSVRSDFDLAQQITAEGATWLDHRLVEKTPITIAQKGFGKEIHLAMGKRLEYLEQQGLTRMSGNQVMPASNLIKTLREKEIGTLVKTITEKSGLPHQPVKSGETVQGIYRRRFSLASGRYALIDNGMGFQLVPWAPQMEKKLGQHISGVARTTGGIQWSLDKKRGLSM